MLTLRKKSENIHNSKNHQDAIPSLSLDKLLLVLFTPSSSSILGNAKKCHLPLSSVIFNNAT